MKKEYITPCCIKQEIAECCKFLASSGVSGDNGIEYGGVDTNGNLEPAAKENHNYSIWDNEW